MLSQLQERITARVTENETVSKAFAVRNGVKQDFVLAPASLSLMSSGMLMDACNDELPGLRFFYRTDGSILSSRRVQASKYLSTTTIHVRLFADDCELNTETGADAHGVWNSPPPVVPTSG
nr:unnamed protein product [Spirometra erinaceieuropaei]